LTSYGAIFKIYLPPPSEDLTQDTTGSEPAFDRYAVVVQSQFVSGSRNTIIVVPATGNLAAANISPSVVVQPSPSNGLRQVSVFLPFLIRAIDVNRLAQRVGVMSSGDIRAIENALRDLLWL
jgi:mRNA-degrading endonuclease toxin of MazEF toxin-antitoxin module